MDPGEGNFAEKGKYRGNLVGGGTPMQRFEEAKIGLEALGQSFYTAVESSWLECLEGRPWQQALLKEVSEASRRLATEARALVDELYPWCGLKAANRSTEINRVWRNLHTASQHPLLMPQNHP